MEDRIAIDLSKNELDAFWLSREEHKPFCTQKRPCVRRDATYLKGRRGGRIVRVAAMMAVAAKTDGHREIIGLGLGPSEAETDWMDFPRGLKARGLDGTRLVVSDTHRGLGAAIGRVFEATWPIC